MAYFAHLDPTLTVTRVISVANSVIGEPDESFPATEERGKDFILNVLKLDGEWMQTSYNGNFRKNYAGIGYQFDQTRDAFIPPKPYPSWVLNESLCLWEPPVPYPDNGGKYEWDEQTISWKEKA